MARTKTAGVRTKPRRPQGEGGIPVRSVRISDEVWERARTRAISEGVTISHALATFAEGYGEGKLSLPRLQLVYPQENTHGMTAS